ncbi:sigma-70 family RNA polymerase sigma factor [Amycolatopsis alkalitolerans]|uniref:Sigma-70 family RNA polymerase sigma factor n=1 Tax=Amycolatopsis alkalitolerans TaxID=2547244 RepID=A0A5C4M0A7_9PSEU|nr:sigma-70 family RNA polymerase sigma factor [Amycolatopsis alkalitolerans]TNC24880.1 sigma-70 family RNA polymerase sigma factor [Amycolatopsis alkalitolerans]
MGRKDRIVPSVEDGLVSSAVAGDRGAVGELVRWLEPLVLRHCRHKVLPGERWRVDVDDLAQEVVLAVLKALPRYPYDAEVFLPYVLTIANRKLSESRRTARYRYAVPVGEFGDDEWRLSDTSPDPGDEVERSDLGRRLGHLMCTLPPRTRRILQLRVLDGLSAQETADALGIASAGAVRVTQHRALAHLRKGAMADARFPAR